MGEYLYVPDMSSLKPCPWAPGHVSVLGRFEEKTPIDGLQGEAALTVPLCPRTTLKRIVACVSRGFIISSRSLMSSQ